MGISRLEFDELVRKRKRCRLFNCSSDVAQGAPAPPKATDPEKSVFLNHEPPIFSRAVFKYDFSRKLTFLTDEITEIKSGLDDYQSRINDGSNLGLGAFVNQGNKITNELTKSQGRTEGQILMHDSFELEDLQYLYKHIIETNPYHPPNHPKIPRDIKSKTRLIEALTGESEYGYEPTYLMEYYHSLGPRQQEPLPPLQPPVMIPPPQPPQQPPSPP